MTKSVESPRGTNRTRRSLAKAALLAVGAVATLPVGSRKAQASWGWGGWGGGGGGSGCFLRGTRIRTATGYRPIEELSPGDLLPTTFGDLRPVKSVGSFRLEGDEAEATPPVRIKAGALGEHSPTADLWLTADHAIFVDGALVPIGNLVNGTTILIDDSLPPDSLEFFHIELADHDVIEAEGATCETLRDPDTRACAPVLNFNGHRNELKSRLRSALSPMIDRREPLDVIRDNLEERGVRLA